MITIPRGEYKGTKEQLIRALDRYKAALEDHKLSVGVPAPWPELDILPKLLEVDMAEVELEIEKEVPGEEPVPDTNVFIKTLVRLEQRIEAAELRLAELESKAPIVRTP